MSLWRLHMGLKKIALILLTSIICSCTTHGRIVQDFYYTYSYDLFDDYVLDTSGKNSFGVIQYFEASFIRKSIEKVQGFTVYEGESILPLLNAKPNVDPASPRELPFYKVVGIFKDENCKQLFNNSDLISAKKNIEEIHLLIKTNEEFQKEKLASKFLSGKWLN